MDHLTDLAEEIYEYAHRPQHWSTYGEMPTVDRLTIIIRAWKRDKERRTEEALEEYARETDEVVPR